MRSPNSTSAALTKTRTPPRPGLKMPFLFSFRAKKKRERHREEMEAHKRMRAEGDAAGGQDGGEHWHAKWDDGEREQEEEDEDESSRMDALPDKILEAVLLATTRDAPIHLRRRWCRCSLYVECGTPSFVGTRLTVQGRWSGRSAKAISRWWSGWKTKVVPSTIADYAIQSRREGIWRC
jgi:hypothetical protein